MSIFEPTDHFGDDFLFLKFILLESIVESTGWLLNISCLAGRFDSDTAGTVYRVIACEMVLYIVQDCESLDQEERFIGFNNRAIWRRQRS